MGETGQRWWDLIPKLPKWILSGITFVVAVVGFVELLDNNFDLVSSVVLVIAGTGAILGCVYLAFKRPPADAEASSSGTRPRRIANLAGLAGLVLVPLLAVGGFAYYRHATDPCGIGHNPGVEHSPEDASTYVQRGIDSMSKKDFPHAEKNFDWAIRLEPRSAWAYKQRGILRLSQDDAAGALEDFDRAICLDAEGDESAYVYRGIALEEKGDIPGALEDYSEAIRLNHSYAWAYKHRGSARERQGDIQGALKDYTEAIRFNPRGDSDEYVARGLLRQKLGDEPGAFADFTQAIDVGPSDPDPHRKLGAWYEENNDLGQAIAHYERFLDLNQEQELDAAVRQHVRELQAAALTTRP